MWSMEYVQVPCVDPNDEDILKDTTESNKNTEMKFDKGKGNYITK